MTEIVAFILLKEREGKKTQIEVQVGIYPYREISVSLSILLLRETSTVLLVGLPHTL